MMKIQDILAKCDHTLLAKTATWEDIRTVCDDGMHYGVASVCIPPSYVARAKKYVGDNLKICTVVGFPNGYQTTSVKLFETVDAISAGADEIDMVINLGELRAGNEAYVRDEIRILKAACGDKILKVIVEACLLTEDEKIRMCELVTEAGADYIKTSTGFASGGATHEDVALFALHVGEHVKVKAAGGISDLADAEAFLHFGAERLGTSRIVKAVKAMEEHTDPHDGGTY